MYAFLLVAKVLQKIQSECTFDKVLLTKGLLLQKCEGVIYVEMTINELTIKTSAPDHYAYGTILHGGSQPMIPSRLCSVFKQMIDY